MENETGTICLCGERLPRYAITYGATTCEKCAWRNAESFTRAGMYETLEIVAREIVAYLTDENGEIDTTNLDDTLTENADSCVPVYYGEQVREWYAVDMPRPDDYGFEDNGLLTEIIATGLYGWYLQELTRKVQELTGETVYGDKSF